MKRMVVARIVTVATSTVLVMGQPLAVHAAAPRLTLFEHSNFEGRSDDINATGCTTLQPAFQDVARSLVQQGGTESVTLFEHPNCTGPSDVVHGNAPDLGSFDDAVVSVLVPK